MNQIAFGNIKFSEHEIKDLIIAWLAISFAFANILSSDSSGIMISFVISSLTVGLGFILHELGHKILAQKFGAWAEFRASKQMLLMAVIVSFLGFVFAAPGAVIIQGRTIGKKRNGMISAAGPVMNFILALVFLGIKFIYPIGFLSTIGSYGFMINTWLGAFNLIPFANFDGKKILEWDKVVYGVLVGVAFVLFYVDGII